MKNVMFFLLFFCLHITLNAQVGINTEKPDKSAYLDVTGSKKGILPPRLSATDRDTLDKLGSIDGPATGLVIYNTSVGALQVNKGTKSDPDWTTLGEGGGTTLNPSDDAIWYYLPVTPLSMVSSALQGLDLYSIYEDQLAKPLGLKYDIKQVQFVLLGYDKTAFTSISISDHPVQPVGYNTTLLYKAIPANVTDVTYVNIAIKINK